MPKHRPFLKILHGLLPAGGAARRSAPALRPGDKFVLCRPRGGLNDTLCQIEKCWGYAETFSRTLIVDSTRSALLGDFADYFQPRHSGAQVHFRLTAPQLRLLDTLPCHPHQLRGKLKTYQPAYSKSAGNYLDKKTSTRLGFDFARDYEEAVLVHEQCGGGNDSFALLDRIAIAADIRPLILDRIRPLGQDYAAVHVRNTDYKTEYENLFRDIYPRVSNKALLVCSDDAAVVAHAQAFFDKSKILVSSRATHTGNRSLHFKYKKHGNERQRRTSAIDSLVDLIALGGASEIYFTNVTAGFPSGFSTLAAYLCGHKQVINALLHN